MAGFDDVMERLITDPGFREQLAADARSALSGYDLSEDEARVLASCLEEEAGQSKVEQRTSKAGLVAFVSEAVRAIPVRDSVRVDSGFAADTAVGRSRPDELSPARSGGGGVNEIAMDDTKGSEPPGTPKAHDGTIVIRGKDITVKGGTAMEADAIGSPDAPGPIGDADHGQGTYSTSVRVGQPWGGDSANPSSTGGTNAAETVVTAPGSAAPGEPRRNDIAMEGIALSHEGLSAIDDAAGSERITVHRDHDV